MPSNSKEYSKKYYQEHKEGWYNKELQRAYYIKRKKYLNIGTRKKRWQNRVKAIKLYGRKCKCCGEREIKFLCFDHVNNDGYLKRKEVNYNIASFIRFLLKNKPNNIQLLCYNCNHAKSFYEICPHKLKSNHVRKISQYNYVPKKDGKRNFKI